MRGMIVGGWEYIRAAYMLTALFLGVYAVSILLRYRRELRRQDAERSER